LRLEFELCLRLGKTRGELRASMTYREFMQWAIWNRVSPIGDERCHDLGPALQRKTLVDLHTPKGGKDTRLDDFLPFAYRPPGLSDVEREILRWAKDQGARDA